MNYALIENNAVAAYPYSLTRFAVERNVSLPANPPAERLAEFGIYAVAETAPPAVDLTKNVIEATPTLVNGIWSQAWQIVDASPAEIAARQEAEKDATARAAAKADAFVQQFIAMTPAQVSAYVDANVTNLAGARALLHKMALLLLLLARREFR